MALLIKQIPELFTEVRDLLQDQQKTRWTDQELYRYLDQAVRNIAISTKYNLIKQTITVSPTAQNPTTYTLDFEAIEFYKIDSEQPYEILDANTIRFPEAKDEEVKVEYYAYPKRIVYGATTSLMLDEDMIDAAVFFIGYRAYQKEASVENINKANYFRDEYSTRLSANLTRWHGKFEVKSSRTDFY